MFLKTTILVFAVFMTFVNATEVNQCPNGKSRKLESNEVSVTNCEKGECKLKRKTTVGIEMKITPEKDINSLITSVSAKILEIPLPFPGVDGTSACNNIYSADGETKMSCPLKAGETYLYKNSFRILEIYPTVNLVVHWALQSDNQDIACFEVPAKITR